MDIIKTVFHLHIYSTTIGKTPPAPGCGRPFTHSRHGGIRGPASDTGWERSNRAGGFVTQCTGYRIFKRINVDSMALCPDTRSGGGWEGQDDGNRDFYRFGNRARGMDRLPPLSGGPRLQTESGVSAVQFPPLDGGGRIVLEGADIGREAHGARIAGDVARHAGFDSLVDKRRIP